MSGVTAHASSAARALLVKGPPAGYDHRVLQPQSASLVTKKYPQLLRLVEKGA
jgi:hypothetical protein